MPFFDSELLGQLTTSSNETRKVVVEPTRLTANLPPACLVSFWLQVGVAALHLGAGRATKEAEIDHAVGVVCRKKRGDEVEAGEVLAEVHARDDAAAAEAAREVLGAYEVGDEPPRQRGIVLDVIG